MARTGNRWVRASPRFFELAAERHGARTAIVDERGSLSFIDLNARPTRSRAA